MDTQPASHGHHGPGGALDSAWAGASVRRGGRPRGAGARPLTGGRMRVPRGEPPAHMALGDPVVGLPAPAMSTTNGVTLLPLRVHQPGITPGPAMHGRVRSVTPTTRKRDGSLPASGARSGTCTQATMRAAHAARHTTQPPRFRPRAPKVRSA